MSELDQLDLLELVLADDAANVFPVGARFAAKTGGISGQTHGQAGGFERFIPIEIRYRHFSRGNQP
jgi:hypothetical protein